MADIYKNAASTIIWTGPEDIHTDELFEDINGLGKIIHTRGTLELLLQIGMPIGHDNAEFQEVVSKIKESLHDIFLPARLKIDETIKLLSSIANLLSREYWKRVWIIQEFIVSTTVLIRCGRFEAPFDHFLSIALLLAPILHSNVQTLYSYIIMERVYRTGELPEENRVEAVLLKGLRELQSIDIPLQASKLGGMRMRYHENRIAGTTITPETQRISVLRHPLERKSMKDGWPLIQLLNKAYVGSLAGATDDRDRIYSLLGLAVDARDLDIKVDYGESVTVLDVYKDAARAMIFEGHVDLLSLARHHNSEHLWPSWTPDWRCEIPTPCGQMPWDTSFLVSGKHTFKKGLTPAWRFWLFFKRCVMSILGRWLGNLLLRQSKASYSKGTTISADTDEIILSGFMVDTIEAGGSRWNPGPDFEFLKDQTTVSEYLSEIGDLCDQSDQKFATTKSDVYLTNPKYSRATARYLIPTADQERYELGSIRRAVDPEFSRKGWEQILDDHSKVQAKTVIQDSTPEKRSYQTMMARQRDRRPFLSVQGYVGLAPDSAEIGDIMVIFLGAKLPYVLRQTSDSRWCVVGEAYIHGIMYGEYFGRRRASRDFILV